MKLLLCLAALVAVASCLPSPLQQQQQIQSVFQFNEMINCATDEWFLTAVWSYNGYGCYCGLGGEGDPVDETDKCCQVHDACYDAASENGCFALDKYLVEYKYSAWRSNPFKPSTCDIKCTPEEDYYFWEFNEDCKAYMCECDKQGALCFARTADTWDKKYQGWSQSHCK